MNAGRPRRDLRVRDRRGPRATQAGIAAVEDPHRLEAVGAQAPPGPGREQALACRRRRRRSCRRRSRSAPRAPPSGPGRRAGSRRRRRRRRSGRSRQSTCDGARDVAGRVDRRGAAVGPPAERRGRGPRTGRGSRPATRSWPGCSGRAKPLIVGIIRPWSPPSCPTRRSWRPSATAIPALAAGIYLNTGSVGPLPAETAAAMAEIAAYERDVGRAHPDYFAELTRADGRGAGRRRGGPRHGRRRGRLTHSTTDGMNAATLAARLAAGRPGGDDAPRAPRRPRAARTRSATGTASTLAFVDAGDDGDDARTLAAFEAAITPDTRLVSISHVLWTTGAVLPVARHRRASPTTAARSSSSTAPRRPARSRSGSRTSARTCTPSPAQKWLLGPEGMGALVVDPGASSSGSPRRSAASSASRRSTAPATRDLVAGCPPVRGDRLPPAVGRRDGPLDRLAVDVRRARLRLPARARRWPPRPPTASPRSRASTVLTPRHAMATLVTFRIAGWPAAGRPRRARRRGSSRSPGRSPSLDALRISVGFFTTDEELERFAEAVELLAAHTPETLPPRRTLAILGEG